jgi:hypothetical protein
VSKRRAGNAMDNKDKIKPVAGSRASTGNIKDRLVSAIKKPPPKCALLRCPSLVKGCEINCTSLGEPSCRALAREEKT